MARIRARARSAVPACRSRVSIGASAARSSSNWVRSASRSTGPSERLAQPLLQRPSAAGDRAGRRQDLRIAGLPALNQHQRVGHGDAAARTGRQRGGGAHPVFRARSKASPGKHELEYLVGRVMVHGRGPHGLSVQPDTLGEEVAMSSGWGMLELVVVVAGWVLWRSAKSVQGPPPPVIRCPEGTSARPPTWPSGVGCWAPIWTTSGIPDGPRVSRVTRETGPSRPSPG